MPELVDATDAEIVAELERRATVGHPVLASCSECTRQDALVSIECADHGSRGFPARPRVLYRLSEELRPVLREIASRRSAGEPIDLQEFETVQAFQRGEPV